MAVKENPYKKYLREDRLPHIFCPGCGNGIVMNAFFKGLEGSEVDFDNVSMVSGIGCSSRIPGYVKCDSLHTTHGRALSFATGLKVGILIRMLLFSLETVMLLPLEEII